MQAGLPDILDLGLQVVFCGINPGLRAAGSGHHFDGRGNRFWRVLHLSGFTPHEIRPEEDRTILEYECGLTAAVARASASAVEVPAYEIQCAATTLEEKIRAHAPRYIAFLGKAALLAISRKRDLEWGAQHHLFGGASVWMLPNPSGRNRGFSLDELAAHYRELRFEMGPRPIRRASGELLLSS